MIKVSRLDQNTVTYWGVDLGLSRVNLNPENILWYPIKCEWAKRKLTIMPSSKITIDITLPNSTGVYKKIKLEPKNHVK